MLLFVHCCFMRFANINFHELSKTEIFFTFCWDDKTCDFVSIMLIYHLWLLWNLTFLLACLGLGFCCRVILIYSGSKSILLIFFFTFFLLGNDHILILQLIITLNLIFSLHFMMVWKNGVAARKEAMILAYFWKFQGKRSPLFLFSSLLF